MTDDDTDRLVRTRTSLHQVAEHVLAGALKRATGQIALEASPGGFRTPTYGDGRWLAVHGTDLVVGDPAGARRVALTTVRAAAEAAGTEPGFPWTKHPPTTPLEPDRPLDLDPDSAATLAGWFALGAEALRRLAADIPGDDPSPAQVWPEHFDLGLAAAAVNYGFSPGDETVPVPYVYIGPHGGPPERDDFWNAAFGAYRTIADVPGADQALAFLLAGRDRVTSR